MVESRSVLVNLQDERTRPPQAHEPCVPPVEDVHPRQSQHVDKPAWFPTQAQFLVVSKGRKAFRCKDPPRPNFLEATGCDVSNRDVCRRATRTPMQAPVNHTEGKRIFSHTKRAISAGISGPKRQLSGCNPRMGNFCQHHWLCEFSPVRC